MTFRVSDQDGKSLVLGWNIHIADWESNHCVMLTSGKCFRYLMSLSALALQVQFMSFKVSD
jgi:hypothetical protein